MTQAPDFSADKIQAADALIKSSVGPAIVTPCDFSPALSARTGGQVFLKGEHLQRTGSFKYRGALHKLLKIRERNPGGSIVAASSGNHGLAVAQAAAFLGLSATIFVPESASPMKLAAIEALGASLTRIPGDGLNAELQARKIAEETGQEFVSPYNDFEVIAGQGTVGLELQRQCEELDAVIVAVGGGGLLGGIGAWFKTHSPKTEMIGAWPEGARAMYACLEAGEIIEVQDEPTLSDGTAGGVEPGSVTFPLLGSVLDSTILVSEEAIASAMKLIASEERWMVEGAAGVAVAALLKDSQRFADKRVAVVVCGRNIALDKFLAVVSA